MAAAAKGLHAVLSGIMSLKHAPNATKGSTAQDMADQELIQSCKPHHRRAVQLALEDLRGERKEAMFRLPAWCEVLLVARVLADARDLPLLIALVQCAMWQTASWAVMTFLLPSTWWSLCWLAVHFPVTWIIFGQRTILGMHYSAHRALFHRRLGLLGRALNHLPQLLLAPFYGMPPGSYYIHHCIMHHQENNVFPFDLSSTAPYQRDSPLHLLHYAANFVLHTLAYLPLLLLRKRRFGVAAASAACSVAYFAAGLYLFGKQPYYTAVAFGSAAVFGPIALMSGNWAQHIFVDPRKPTSNYGLSVNMISAPFNMLSFNDGYHIVHHVSSHTHWSEMPMHFIRNIDRYEEEGALVFHSLNYDDLSYHVFSGQLEKLATYVVQLTPEDKHLSVQELAALMRTRLRPIAVGDAAGSPGRKSATHSLSPTQLLSFALGQVMWLCAYSVGFPTSSFSLLCAAAFALLFPLAFSPRDFVSWA
jgi:hypothetical protein